MCGLAEKEEQKKEVERSLASKYPRRKRTGLGWRLVIKLLSDREGQKAQRHVGCRLMAHRTRCVCRNWEWGAVNSRSDLGNWKWEIGSSWSWSAWDEMRAPRWWHDVFQTTKLCEPLQNSSYQLFFLYFLFLERLVRTAKHRKTVLIDFRTHFFLFFLSQKDFNDRILVGVFWCKYLHPESLKCQL